MVERRPWLVFISHAVLLLGVAVVAFPVYITFVASTHTAQDIVQTPMPMLPVIASVAVIAAVLPIAVVIRSVVVGIMVPVIAAVSVIGMVLVIAVPAAIVSAGSISAARAH